MRRRANIAPEDAAVRDNHDESATKEPDSSAALTRDQDKPAIEDSSPGAAIAESEDELTSGTPPRRLSVLLSH